MTGCTDGEEDGGAVHTDQVWEWRAGLQGEDEVCPRGGQVWDRSPGEATRGPRANGGL